MREIAVRTFEAVGAEGLSRVDVFVTPDEQVVVNEINTMPGFTPFSMYPRMWEKSGLSYPDLIDELVALALESGPPACAERTGDGPEARLGTGSGSAGVARPDARARLRDLHDRAAQVRDERRRVPLRHGGRDDDLHRGVAAVGRERPRALVLHDEPVDAAPSDTTLWHVVVVGPGTSTPHRSVTAAPGSPHAAVAWLVVPTFGRSSPSESGSASTTSAHSGFWASSATGTPTRGAHAAVVATTPSSAGTARARTSRRPDGRGPREGGGERGGTTSSTRPP